MPHFTIDVTDKALAELQLLTDATNQQTGQVLTVKQWMELHFREMAIQRILAANAQAVSQAAVTAERDRLLQHL